MRIIILLNQAACKWYSFATTRAWYSYFFTYRTGIYSADQTPRKITLDPSSNMQCPHLRPNQRRQRVEDSASRIQRRRLHAHMTDAKKQMLSTIDDFLSAKAGTDSMIYLRCAEELSNRRGRWCVLRCDFLFSVQFLTEFDVPESRTLVAAMKSRLEVPAGLPHQLQMIYHASSVIPTLSGNILSLKGIVQKEVMCTSECATCARCHWWISVYPNHQSFQLPTVCS